MSRTRIVVSGAGSAMLVAVGVIVMALALGLGPAGAESEHKCSTRQIAGNWLFNTGVGQFDGVFPAGAPLPEPWVGVFPADGKFTALGTMNIDREGQLEGVFDVTAVGEGGAFSFPGRTYTGTVTVNPDCTGELAFVTGAGSVRTDRIAVISGSEMRAMSLVPTQLWTYEIHKLSGDRDDDD